VFNQFSGFVYDDELSLTGNPKNKLVYLIINKKAILNNIAWWLF